MENREQQILSEIKAMMASIRTQLEALDAKMAELQQCVEPAGEETVPIDLDIADVIETVPMPEAPETAVTVELEMPEEVEEELPEDLPEDDLPAEDPTEEYVPVEEEVVEEDDDLPIFAEPEPAPAAVPPAPKTKEAVIDAMANRQAWRTDMPGTSVKDIRSAISLNDRIIFINYLFNEDPLMFQDALTRINVMTSLDEVVEFITAEHPEWDLDSELVYRFMMAVRRRIR